MLKTRIKLTALLLGASLLAMPVAAQDANTLRIPMFPDPEHLNPFTATTIAISNVNNNIYESLVGLNAPTGEYVPRLAESWTLSDDSLTYSFTDTMKLTVGATNIFDVFPSKQDPNETDNGHIYESVQFGLNGAAYFARFWVKF